MHTTTIAAALLGLSALAAALPTTDTSSSQSSEASTVDAGSDAFEFPLANGFPNITAAKDKDIIALIQAQALGTLAQPGNTTANATKPTGASILGQGFVAFNELMEVAFFTELISNVTNNAPGYGPDDITGDRDEILAILKVHEAQEELHQLNAAGAFTKNSGGQVVEPCKYNFPVSNFAESIRLAATFTDVVMGTLPAIQTIFGKNGDAGLIRGVGASLGQEGEQDGFYRQYLGLAPAGLPFNTQSAVSLAFSAVVQSFIVADSCPQTLELFQNPSFTLEGLTLFDVLTPITDLGNGKGDIQDAEFAGTPVQVNAVTVNSLVAENLCITYLNQNNGPISFKAAVTGGSDKKTFTAPFPGKSLGFSGLVITTVTTGTVDGCGAFLNADDVAAATKFGPFLFEADNFIDDLINESSSSSSTMMSETETSTAAPTATNQ
ncbi:hypothetical protein LTR97_002084 [Elasticomyces elasticus]|uniref:Sexual development protein n=1 Tax=Elasticomyces elasticus TaxID=574655 RepID=A0AAN7WA79_9PEZI|nr:hypothetical protein LTR97_002084 [Elasticomyces elasticus]